MLKIKVVKKGSTTARPVPSHCPWIVDCPPDEPRS
jgi:hypothetical protein